MPTNPLANQLERMIQDGAFDSTVQAEIERITGDTHGPFYRDLGAERIAQMAKATNSETFVPIIRETASSLVAYARAHREGVINATNLTPIILTNIHGMYGPRLKMVAYNAESGHWGVTAKQVFAPDGDLQMQAIVLEAGHTKYGPHAELSIAVADWGPSTNPPNKGDVTVVTFGTDGSKKGVVYTAITMDGASHEPANFGDALVDHLYGVDLIPGIIVSRAEVHRLLRFPYAERYLADHLPLLPKYVADLAASFGHGH